MNDVRIDADRAARTGIPEAVYAPGKTIPQVLAAVRDLLERSPGAVLVTRCDPSQAAALQEHHPDVEIDDVARVAVLRRSQVSPPLGTIAIVTGGTSDAPVAREAAIVAEALGAKTDLLLDRGVAGLHRTLEAAEQLRDADVVIAVAGMEGALPSVLAGLLPMPIVAVPTSVGYGSSLEGVTALLSMLASCAPGIAVVGIDNGFGAAVHAIKILRTRAR